MIETGNIDIITGGDAIQATNVTISNGDISIKSGGGSNVL